jgi:methylenetetrahydrofolate dehydrogenase (NADP+)/methenyltetrahydrofolate cyclohydrolase
MKLIEGKPVSEAVYRDLSVRIGKLKKKGITPGLAVVLVGEDPASKSYVAGKEKTCRNLGIYSKKVDLPASIGESLLLRTVRDLNKDPAVHGILVQSPLPEGLSADAVFETIDPAKDVDGFHPVNTGNLCLERKGFIPCTPLGIVRMLEYYKIPVEGKHAVVIGRSRIVGKPMALLLMRKAKNANATVTVCHSKSENLRDICRSADILIAAIGRPEFVTREFVKPGAVVVDVGFSRVTDASSPKGYRLAGDVAFDEVKETASWITPVPGGVGLMTVAMLMSNVVEAAEKTMNDER